jgi:hypothetical protein
MGRRKSRAPGVLPPQGSVSRKPQNNERPELFRVQGARAALPQNCSPSKIKWTRCPAYSTSVPYALFHARPVHLHENLELRHSRAAKRPALAAEVPVDFVDDSNRQGSSCDHACPHFSIPPFAAAFSRVFRPTVCVVDRQKRNEKRESFSTGTAPSASLACCGTKSLATGTLEDHMGAQWLG